MYTIKLNADKTLTTTIKATLMQKENGVDKIQFLIPQTYLEHDLSDYMITMVWADPNGNLHTGLLDRDVGTYKEYIRCVYTVTKDFLSQSGNIEVWINMMNPALDDDISYKILRSHSTTITVEKPSSYVDFADYETLEAMKQKMKELSNSMPTDLAISEDDNLHLVHAESQIGNGVEIIVPGDNDTEDSEHDGIVEINDSNVDDDMVNTSDEEQDFDIEIISDNGDEDDDGVIIID